MEMQLETIETSEGSVLVQSNYKTNALTFFSFQDTCCSVEVLEMPVVELKQISLPQIASSASGIQGFVSAKHLESIEASEGFVLVKNYKILAATLFSFQDTCCRVEVPGIPVVELKKISFINPELHRLEFQDFIAARQLRNYRDL